MSDSDSATEQSVQDIDHEWEEWDGEDDEEDVTCSLFDGTLLPSPAAALTHDAKVHGFDFAAYVKQHGLDDYEIIKIVNYIRSETAAGRDPRPVLDSAPEGGLDHAPWAGEQYLQPVLQDDPLLTFEFGDEDEALHSHLEQSGRIGERQLDAAGCSQPQQTLAAGDNVALLALAAENRELKLRVAALMDAALPPSVRDELRAAAAADSGIMVAAGCSGAAPAPAACPAAAAAPAEEALREHRAARATTAGVINNGASAAAASVDATYFDSYSSLDIHHDMLADKAYADALLRNPGLLSGAVVLDVGCGSGILSMLAARGGAAAVVGLDGSERMAGLASAVVTANGLDAASGGPVTILAGRAEDVCDLGHTKVDILVSEWMGYALLFESMLDSLLAARDRWLKPGGAVLPDRASIHAAGASRLALGDLPFWQDVYGFSMAPIADELAAAAAREGEVLVRPVPAAALVTPPVMLRSLDLACMAPGEQDFTASFTLTAEGSSAEVAALVLWFDVQFSERFCPEAPGTLSTAPDAPGTHWAQAVLPLPAPVATKADSPLRCRISMARSRARHRALDISLEWAGQGDGDSGARLFTMEVSPTASGAASRGVTT